MRLIHLNLVRGEVIRLVYIGMVEGR